MECSVLKELKLMAGEMLRRRLVSEKVTPVDVEQQAAIDDLQWKVKYEEGQAAFRSTAVYSAENRGDKKMGLAAMTAVVERAPLTRQKGSVLERSRECECFAVRYTKSWSGLENCGCAASFDFPWAAFQSL